MRPQVPHVCSHCQSTKSPLWRRGANMEVLCNACGLYWKHHSAYRPLSLKVAADRKGNNSSSSSSTIAAISAGSEVLRNYSTYHNQQNQPNHQFNHQHNYYPAASSSSTYQHPLAYTNPQLVTTTNLNCENGRIKIDSLRSSNVLLAGPSNNSNYNNINNNNNNDAYGSYKRFGSDIILPPLEYKRTLSLDASFDSSAGSANLSVSANNFSNPSANQRQITPAQVLPTLKQVIGSFLGSDKSKTNSIRSNHVPIKPAPSHKTASALASASSASSENSFVEPGSSFSANMNQVGPKTSATTTSNNAVLSSAAQPIKYIINRGMTIYQGDHVSIRGIDSQVYFAVILDFWLTDSGKRYFIFRWLLPDPKASITAPLQDRFNLGPHHERVESMDAILDVFYSPYRNEWTSLDIRKKFFVEEKPSSSTSTTSAISSVTSSSAVDPPAHLVRAIKNLSNETLQENSEIAAKMLLSMN